MTITKLVLLDDQQLFLDSFQVALTQCPSLDVVGATTDARRAYELVESAKPDLLVCDLLLQATDGVSVARELRRRRAPTGLMILTMQTNRAFVSEAVEAGTRGYALKNQPLNEIVEALQTAAGGKPYFAPSLGIVPTPEHPAIAEPRTDGVLGRLSRREQEVFCRIIYGAGSRDIARDLSISVKTVETHRTHINRKLDVHSPAQLIRVAALAGLLATSRGSAFFEGRHAPAVA